MRVFWNKRKREPPRDPKCARTYQLATFRPTQLYSARHYLTIQLSQVGSARPTQPLTNHLPHQKIQRAVSPESRPSRSRGGRVSADSTQGARTQRSESPHSDRNRRCPPRSKSAPGGTSRGSLFLFFFSHPPQPFLFVFFCFLFFTLSTFWTRYRGIGF
eukprot:COSAG02_NODE_578_length_20075_cov_93.607930_13_plen_159_part_00